MKKLKYILTGVVVILLVGFTVYAATQRKTERKKTSIADIGGNALDFALVDSAGEPFNMSELKGHTVVLNFWASWCMPCVYEMPELQQFYDAQDKNKVKVVLVALDRDFTKSQKFMERKGYTMPYYRPAGNIPAAFNVSAIPTTFIINSNGQIISTYSGMTSFMSPDFQQTIANAD